MNDVYEKLQRCVESVRKKTDFQPELALILGSGLGDYAQRVAVETEISYHDIAGFPVSTVAGHAGCFLFGLIGETPAVVMQGRVHYYEGYPMSDVVLPTRLMKMLGAKVLFLTNAAGGIRDGMQAGDLMLITDQISSFVPSPLIGPNEEALGTRFPDMSHIYSERLQNVIRQSAETLAISLKEGVYAQFTGPQYESPAEVRMAKTLGADAVGMSTACEAIAAAHMGMEVCGISCISNLAAGLSPHPLAHEEVQAAADRVAPQFQELVTQSIRRMSR